MPRLFYLPLVEPGVLLSLKATKKRLIFSLKINRLYLANVKNTPHMNSDGLAAQNLHTPRSGIHIKIIVL